MTNAFFSACPEYPGLPGLPSQVYGESFLHTVKREDFLIMGSDMDNFIFTIPEMFAI